MTLQSRSFIFVNSAISGVDKSEASFNYFKNSNEVTNKFKLLIVNRKNVKLLSLIFSKHLKLMPLFLGTIKTNS